MKNKKIIRLIWIEVINIYPELQLAALLWTSIYSVVSMINTEARLCLIPDDISANSFSPRWKEWTPASAWNVCLECSISRIQGICKLYLLHGRCKHTWELWSFIISTLPPHTPDLKFWEIRLSQVLNVIHLLWAIMLWAIVSIETS